MKKHLLLILSVIPFLSVIASSQESKVEKIIVGKWLFQAPYAPDGYKDGTIEIGYAEKKYSAIMIFSVGENKFVGDRVRFENDTLYFNVFIEGQNVVVKLKDQDETKMTGKAVYNEGVVPLLLTKEIKKE